jgi:hypothetical protein
MVMKAADWTGEPLLLQTWEYSPRRSGHVRVVGRLTMLNPTVATGKISDKSTLRFGRANADKQL